MAFDAPILEDFVVGVDVNPISNDAKWAIFFGNGAVARIEADIDAVTPNTGALDAFYYYTPAGESQNDVEARFLVRVKAADGGRLGVVIRGTPAAALFDGYWLRAETAAGTDLVVLGRIDDGVTSTLDSVFREIVNGDQYCIRARGSALEGWVRPSGGGADELLVSASDTVYTTGAVAINVRTTAAQLDDFGWVGISDAQVGQYVTQPLGRGAA